MRRRSWTEIVHELRRREIEIIFSRCPEGYFRVGLELGAGDGFQSQLLSRYVVRLVSTDVNRARLALSGRGPAQYLVCDAEVAGRTFRPASFDLVFSSNLMEHLSRPEVAFGGIFDLMKGDGVCISVMPNPFMKLMWMLFFYPNKGMRLLEVLSGSSLPDALGDRRAADLWDNNPRPVLPQPAKARRYGFLRRQLWPVPHGAYRSNLEEFIRYRRARWVRLIQNEGLEIIRILKMPVTTGYGFGCDRIRAAMERVGFASGYAYVAVKRGASGAPQGFWSA